MYLRAALLLLLLACGIGGARGGMALNFEHFSAGGIRIEDARMTLAYGGKSPNLSLTIAKIGLPPPFDVLSFVALRCPRFTYADAGVNCTGGRAEIVSPWLDRSTVHVDFQASKQSSALQLQHISFAGGKLQLAIRYTQDEWRAELTAADINMPAVQRLLAVKGFAVGSGRLDLRVAARGRGAEAEDVTVSLKLRKFDAQSSDGKYAAEKLQFGAQLHGKIAANLWQWRHRMEISRGAFYVDPVFIDANQHALKLEGSGKWLPQTRQLRCDDAVLTHGNMARATGRLTFQNGTLQSGSVSLHSGRLDKLMEIYLQPFIAASPWDGIGLAGRLDAQATLAGSKIARLDAELRQLQISDSAQRFAMHNVTGAVHWANDRIPEISRLLWDGMDIYGLPIGASGLQFGASGKSLRLTGPANLPLLGGVLHIARFDWRTAGMQPEIDFQGGIERVSLEKLTDTLHWTPLSGQISGTVPGVQYRNGRIDIGGALQIRLFDGLISIGKMSLSGISGGSPQLTADVTIGNLDLQQLTGRFAFGGMQGRLSGYIRDLQLDNWRPVRFFAWLGTPDDDTSKHRISQTAVNNLASIGGGGASDLLSRGMLRVFDSFGYDRLGIGCYLHRGVCQLFGVEAAAQGFYIVKGGGLPRIDVIGYNSRIDWQILLQRLRRILATDSAIIQ